jgi:ribosome maturation factor RimP
MKSLDLQKLEELVRPAVAGQGYELVELHWGRQPGGMVLRVTIDRPVGQGRVSHDDCVVISREVGALLDVKEALPGKYSLEVSSPGLDRPLKRRSDFERFIGERAKVRLRLDALKSEVGSSPPSKPDAPPAPPRRNFVGTIAAVDDELVRLDAEGVGAVSLHISEIEKANLLYSF